jgi:hypothetical protein
MKKGGINWFYIFLGIIIILAIALPLYFALKGKGEGEGDSSLYTIKEDIMNTDEGFQEVEYYSQINPYPVSLFGKRRKDTDPINIKWDITGRQDPPSVYGIGLKSGVTHDISKILPSSHEFGTQLFTYCGKGNPKLNQIESKERLT